MEWRKWAQGILPEWRKSSKAGLWSWLHNLVNLLKSAIFMGGGASCICNLGVSWLQKQKRVWPHFRETGLVYYYNFVKTNVSWRAGIPPLQKRTCRRSHADNIQCENHITEVPDSSPHNIILWRRLALPHNSPKETVISGVLINV